MHRIKPKIFSPTVVGILLMLAFSLTAVDRTLSSRQKVRYMANVIEKYMQAEENLSDKDVQAAIFSDLKESDRIKFEPEKKLLSSSITDMQPQVREMVKKRFPKSAEELKKSVHEEAEKRFQQAELLDEVSVSYRKGNRYFKKAGTFYSYGGNSVNIGGETIAIFDLVPEDRVKFDKSFRESEKEKFINDSIRNYFNDKLMYANSVREKLKSTIITANEEAGYIYIQDGWKTPREVCRLLINKYIEEQRKLMAAKNEAGGESADTSETTGPEPDKGETQIPPDDEEQRRVELLRKVEQELYNIKNTFYGIDSDQGYENALWWMKHDDVALLFDEISPGEASVEKIGYDSGPLESVEMHFYKSHFYKVVLTFRTEPREGVLSIWSKLRNRYGRSDQEKKLDHFEKLRKNTKPCPEGECEYVDGYWYCRKCGRVKPCNKRTPQEKHDFADNTYSECSKCGAIAPCTKEREKNGLSHEFDELGICKHCGKKAGPPAPKEQLLTWSGKVTRGGLSIKLDESRTKFTFFQLVKENPEVVEQLKAIDVQKAEEEEERKKKKQLEEFNKFDEF